MPGPLIALAAFALCSLLSQGSWGQAGAPAMEAAFHVSPLGNDSWSGRRPDPAADGSDGPFATLARARDAARGDAGIRVIRLRGGLYPLTEALELEAADTGLTIAAYPGETPVLSGGERVEDLSDQGDGTMAAPLGRPPGLDVFQGDRRLIAAPSGDVDSADPIRSGWLIVREAGDGPAKSAFRWRDGDLDPALLHPGLLVQVFDRDRLADDILTVARVDAASRTLHLNGKARYALRDGGTFRLPGLPAFLRQPGQFAWDDDGGRLLVRPADPQPANPQSANPQSAGPQSAGPATPGRDGVVVARQAPLVRIAGAANVSLRGLTFAHVPYDGAAVVVEKAEDTVIAGSRFVHVGTAVALSEVTGALVAGNEMVHLGTNGVELAVGCERNTVIDNHIHQIGEIRKDAGGIMAYGAKNNRLAHNDIEFSARYGISIKNWNNATRGMGNVIEFNRIRHVGRETADGGAIEMLGRSNIDTRTIIRHNMIEHTGGLATDRDGRWLERSRGWGVFLDDLTNGVTVTGNFFRDTGPAAVFIHGGDRNRVENNIALLGSDDARFIRLEWAPQAGPAGNLYDNTVMRNVIVGTVPVPTWWFDNRGGFSVMDQNLLYGVGQLVKGGADAGSLAGSSYGDPRFADPGAGDFRLKPDSPALALGFRDLPWERIGRRGWGAAPETPAPLRSEADRHPF